MVRLSGRGVVEVNLCEVDDDVSFGGGGVSLMWSRVSLDELAPLFSVSKDRDDLEW